MAGALARVVLRHSGQQREKCRYGRAFRRRAHPDLGSQGVCRALVQDLLPCQQIIDPHPQRSGQQLLAHNVAACDVEES